MKFIVVVALLFLAQALVGGAVAHYRADPGSFYGFDLARIFPSNLLRTWHLQLAIFWIATAYVGGALFLGRSLGADEPRWQRWLDPRAVRRVRGGGRSAACWASGWASSQLLGAVVLVRQPGLGVSGARPLLADPAGRRACSSGSACCCGAGARRRAGGSGAPPLVNVLPDRRAGDPVLLSAGLVLRRHDPLHGGRYLALLDHPSLGRGLLRVLRHGRWSRIIFYQARAGRAQDALRVIYLDAILYFGGGLDRHRPPLVLHRPDRTSTWRCRRSSPRSRSCR